MRWKISTWVPVMAAVMSMVVAPAVAVDGVDAADAESQPVDLLMSDDLTREDLVEMYRALGAGGSEPPDCVEGDEMFDDVPATNPFCSWIEELARRGVTSGCDANNYCPGDPVSRAQMAAFLLRTTDRPVVREVESQTLSPGTHGFATVSCPAGTRLVSGGGLISSAATGGFLTSSVASQDFDGWVAGAWNTNDSVGLTVQAFAYCRQ